MNEKNDLSLLLLSSVILFYCSMLFCYIFRSFYPFFGQDSVELTGMHWAEMGGAGSEKDSSQESNSGCHGRTDTMCWRAVHRAIDTSFYPNWYTFRICCLGFEPNTCVLLPMLYPKLLSLSFLINWKIRSDLKIKDACCVWIVDLLKSRDALFRYNALSKWSQRRDLWLQGSG